MLSHPDSYLEITKDLLIEIEILGDAWYIFLITIISLPSLHETL